MREWERKARRRREWGEKAGRQCRGHNVMVDKSYDRLRMLSLKLRQTLGFQDPIIILNIVEGPKALHFVCDIGPYLQY